MRMLALTILVAAATALAAETEAPTERDVRIYVPRDLRVDTEELTLGQVCVVLAGQEDLEKKAKSLPMGRAPWAKEALPIDRNTILGRLATIGIAKEQVRFTGADAVAVCRTERIIRADAMQAAAEEHLKRTAPAEKDSIYRVLRRPDDVTLTGAGEPEIACSMGDTPAAGQVRVTITLSREGKQLAQREAVFQKYFPIRRAVASKDIAAGETLTEQNVEVQTTWSPTPAAAEWKSPLGLLASRRVQAGTLIRADMTASQKPDLAIERNQMVRMRVQGDGFTISTVGQAIEPGKVGDFIKVRNMDSKRIVTARVAFDGAVEPVFKK